MWLMGGTICDSTVMSCHPVQPHQSLCHDDVLLIKKFLAKATLAEHLTILGWLIDTRCLQIELPENKYTAWMTMIDKLLSQPRVTAWEIDTLLGYHARFIIPMS